MVVHVTKHKARTNVGPQMCVIKPLMKTPFNMTLVYEIKDRIQQKFDLWITKMWDFLDLFSITQVTKNSGPGLITSTIRNTHLCLETWALMPRIQMAF
jgi:hypothetical protein